MHLGVLVDLEAAHAVVDAGLDDRDVEGVGDLNRVVVEVSAYFIIKIRT